MRLTTKPERMELIVGDLKEKLKRAEAERDNLRACVDFLIDQIELRGGPKRRKKK